MCERGQVLPSEYVDLVLPTILTALLLTTLTLVAQRVGQLRQEVATHFCVRTPSVLSCGSSRRLISERFMT